MKLSNDYPSLERKPKSKLLSRLFLGVTFLLVLCAGYIVGQSSVTAQNQLDLTEFWQAYNIIENRFVGSVQKDKAEEGALAGLVESIYYPFSSYFPIQKKKDLDTELSGQFEGIGAELTTKDGLTTVVAPLDNSPAQKAGLKAKDVVIKVDDTATEDLTLDEVVALIRGPKDSQVKITIFRQGVDNPIKLKITRSQIQVKSVKYQNLNDGIGYIEVTQFGDDTVELFKQALSQLSKSSLKALIIDLQNNPGGYLNTVAPIVGQFIAPSVIVKERYKDGRVEELRSVETPTLPNIPLYILVNAGSASASEIVAGTFQDYKRATIIGQKTFGKGSVQEIFPLKGGSALRLTIAEWLTPNDRQITKKGIEPDMIVAAEKTAEINPPLNKALELISSTAN